MNQVTQIIELNSAFILCKIIKEKTDISNDIATQINYQCKNENTKNNYMNRLKNINCNNNFPINTDYRILLRLLKELCPSLNLNTMLSIINTILKFTELSELFKNDVGEDNIKFLKKTANTLYTQSKLNQQKARDNDVNWDYLLSLEDRLDDNDIDLSRSEKLLYKLYVSPTVGVIPRNDFAAMKIVDTFTDANDISFNYFVKDAKKMIFNEFKNSASVGQLIQDVPDEIIKYINLSDKYLFIAKDNKISENTLSKKKQRTFYKLRGGKNITINTLRRSYCNKQKKTSEVIDIITDAAATMHSIGTHLNYQHDGGIDI